MSAKTLMIGALVLAATFAAAAPARADDPFIGELRIFAAPYCPEGWLPTTGGYYRGEDFYGLFALLGHKYGGQGNYFRVPNNPPLEAAGNHKLRECIAYSGYFPY